MLQSMLIVDDFYEKPLEVRTRALAMDFPLDRGKVVYPGRNSEGAWLPPGSDRVFSALLRDPVQPNPKTYHGAFRIALEGDERQAEVHIDTGCSWAGIVYLTPDEFCQGGTEFYRHRHYGSDHAPRDDDEAQRVYGMATTREVIAALVGPGKDSRDLSKWEMTQILPMRFNRLVLFRPWLWHRSGIDFGNSPENGRLIQTLFFIPAEATVKASTTP